MVATLKASDHGRLQELLPIRYGRMIQSPFAFFRGAASVMAVDLAGTPNTGLRVQACGDCHLLNFGGYGSPERQLVFDINDFDETLPAPWEWDVKRLAASVVLAGRQIGARDRICGDAALATVASYRTHMREYARMTALNTWYSHLDAEIFIKEAKTLEDKKYWRQMEKSAKLQTAEHIFPKMTEVVRGRRRIVDRPPLVFHPRDFAKIDEHVRAMFHRYRQTLPDERRVILDRYQIVDIARKVVGVGSVGTRCAVALLMAGENDALFLQFKEALPSVLEAVRGEKPLSESWRARRDRTAHVAGVERRVSGLDTRRRWPRLLFPPAARHEDVRGRGEIEQKRADGIRGGVRMGAGARACAYRGRREDRRVFGQERGVRSGRAKIRDGVRGADRARSSDAGESRARRKAASVNPFGGLTLQTPTSVLVIPSGARDLLFCTMLQGRGLRNRHEQARCFTDRAAAGFCR